MTSPQRSTGYAWLIAVVSGIIIGIGFGTMATISVFLKPLSQEFGWSRGEISFGYTLAAVFTGLGCIAAGYLADRISPRIQVFAGGIVMGGACLVMSRGTELWHFYLLYGVMIGGLCQGVFMTSLVANVGFWFEKHRGLAMGTALAGQGIGGALIPLAARYLITEWGWRDAYLALGVFALLVMLPLALLLTEAPGIAAQRAASRATPDNSAGRTRTGLTIWQLGASLGVAGLLCCTCMALPQVHVVSIAIDAGISAQAAASVLTVLMLVGIVGRVGVGKLADHIGALRTVWIASLGQTATVFWFTQVHSLSGLYLVALLFAPGSGGLMTAYAITVRELFPAHRVGSVLGWVFCLSWVGMGVGGVIAGAMFDWTGAYAAPFAIGAAAGAINLVIIGWLYLRLRVREPMVAVPDPA